jgi:hypothetical protein
MPRYPGGVAIHQLAIAVVGTDMQNRTKAKVNPSRKIALSDITTLLVLP